MDRLWDRDVDSTTVRELFDELAAERDIAYTTVMSTMDNLHRKGWLARERDGRAYRYWPTMTREEHSAQLMHEALGIGLAATQLGVMHRVLVYRVEPDAPVAALVNPALEWAGKEKEALEEGCLSLPGVLVDVDRPIHVRVRGQDEYGDELLIEASGLEARVIQHEMDHLDGVLILERTSRDERKQAMRILREEAKAAPLGVAS